jgi:predicted flap endonuclease-1-like 5' DNA nuclease
MVEEYLTDPENLAEPPKKLSRSEGEVSQSSSKSANPEKSVSSDDFKKIHGIGASIERHLHQAGVLTYAQLAGLSPQEIANLLDNVINVTPERIAEQDWVGMARQFTEEQEKTRSLNSPAPQDERQRYATFKIEFLINEENQVRRTLIEHVQNDDKDKWAGWDENRILSFLQKEADLQLLTPEPAIPEMAVEKPISSKPKPLPTQQVPATAQFSITATPEENFMAKHTVLSGQTLQQIANEHYGSGAKVKWMRIYDANQNLIGDDPNNLLAGQMLNIPPALDESRLEILDATLHEVDGVTPSNIIGSDLNWSIHIEWELTDATPELLTGDWLVQAYLESMGPGTEYALPPGSGDKVPLANGTPIAANDYRYSHDIIVAAGVVDPGVYKMVVTVVKEREAGVPSDLVNFLEKGMVQLYERN